MKEEVLRGSSRTWLAGATPWEFLLNCTMKPSRDCCVVLASCSKNTAHMHTLLSTMTQFFRQDDLVNVSHFLYACLDVMLRADSDDQCQTSEQPQVAGRGEID